MRTKTLKIVAPLALLLLIGAGCFGKQQATVTVPPPAPATPPPIAEGEQNPAGGTVPSTDMRVAGNFIFVAEQRPGRTVTVHGLSTNAPTIVVIRATEDASAPSLGASAVVTGENLENVVVNLSRETKDGETLYAYAYVDEGNGKYDGSEKALLDFRDSPLYARFSIDANAELNPQITL